MPKYFFAILPPTAIEGEIISFQKEIGERFGAVHAQKTPPHITVIPPFHCEKERLNKFAENLKDYYKSNPTPNIHITLENFQKFESRTLFVDVAKNNRFESWCKQLKLLFNQEKIIKQRVEKHFFVPHITIANKDLKKRDFKTAWKELKERKYLRSFELNKLIVLELQSQKWIQIINITL